MAFMQPVITASNNRHAQQMILRPKKRADEALGTGQFNLAQLLYKSTSQDLLFHFISFHCFIITSTFCKLSCSLEHSLSVSFSTESLLSSIFSRNQCSKLNKLLPLLLKQNIEHHHCSISIYFLIQFSTRWCILSCHCSRFCSYLYLSSVWLPKIHHMPVIIRLPSVAGHIPALHILGRTIVRLCGMHPQASATQEISKG